MKTLVLTLCLSLSTLAHADWMVVARNIDGTVFETTIENDAISGSMILIWERSTRLDGSSSISLVQYDCDHIRTMLHEGFEYDSSGNLVDRWQGSRKWLSIPPRLDDKRAV